MGKEANKYEQRHLSAVKGVVRAQVYLQTEGLSVAIIMPPRNTETPACGDELHASDAQCFLVISLDFEPNRPDGECVDVTCHLKHRWSSVWAQEM